MKVWLKLLMYLKQKGVPLLRLPEKTLRKRPAEKTQIETIRFSLMLKSFWLWEVGDGDCGGGKWVMAFVLSSYNRRKGSVVVNICRYGVVVRDIEEYGAIVRDAEE
ncbi:hypothetical protein L6452_23154 [Arctium lappa]|uniref:Uncharacterized protein n=1 Tax=Arctium lappa TaxID=4217 RepID=A0ACB9B1W3_ARCLA|nr:hypothetical protein L6452_23154 [Arctium lappa]